MMYQSIQICAHLSMYLGLHNDNPVNISVPVFNFDMAVTASLLMKIFDGQ